ncbi:MAG: hypothetical protein U0519_04740 [Candidatus Gracilibacteria bacterium]
MKEEKLDSPFHQASIVRKKKAHKLTFDRLGGIDASGSLVSLRRGVSPLSKFVHEDLIPRQMDVLVLEALNEFHASLMGVAFGFLQDCRGLFVAPDHCWAAGFDDVNAAIKTGYDVEMEGPTLILPLENMRYWSMVHESMHAVFHALPHGVKQHLVGSAVSSYPTTESFHSMLDLTHLNISHVQYRDEVHAEMQEIMKRPGIESTKYGHLFTLANTVERDQYMVVDEFIANFYTNDRVTNRWNPDHFPSTFKSTLGNIGYNVIDPPEVQ